MRRKHLTKNSSGLCPRHSSSLQIVRTFSESQRGLKTIGCRSRNSAQGLNRSSRTRLLNPAEKLRSNKRGLRRLRSQTNGMSRVRRREVSQFRQVGHAKCSLRLSGRSFHFLCVFCVLCGHSSFLRLRLRRATPICDCKTWPRALAPHLSTGHFCFPKAAARISASRAGVGFHRPPVTTNRL